MDGTHKQVVVHEGIKEPTDLVIDPNNRMLYWTDAGMDGIYRIRTDSVSTDSNKLTPEIVRGDVAEGTGVAIIGPNMYSLKNFREI